MKLLVFLLACLAFSPLAALDVSSPTVFDHPVTRKDQAFLETFRQVAYDGPWVADFTQTKQIHGVNRTFRSSGTMFLQPGRGIVWNVLSPYPSVMVVGSSSIVQQLPGRKLSRIDFGDNPVFTQISRTIALVLAGNLTELEASFFLSFQQAGSEWTLALVPKTKEIASFVSSFVLAGNAQLETVLMRERGGDSTRYEFSSIERRSLKEDELACFSW